MNYNIKGTAIQLTDEVRAYLDRKLAHAEKFMRANAAARLDVELEFIAGAAGPKYRAEYSLVLGNYAVRAEAYGASLHEAIDVAADEFAHKLSRAKDKQQHLFRRGAAKIKDYIRGWRSDAE